MLLCAIGKAMQQAGQHDFAVSKSETHPSYRGCTDVNLLDLIVPRFAIATRYFVLKLFI